MMKYDPESGLWLPDKPRLCSLFPAIHGVAGASGSGAAAISKIQSASAISGNASSRAVTLGSTPIENNWLIGVGMATNDSPAPTLSASGFSEVFSPDFAVTYGPGFDGALQIFYKQAGASESTTVTLDCNTTAGTIGFAVAEFAGIVSSPLDVSANNDETSGTSRVADSGTTATTAQANALAIAICCILDGDFDANPTFSDSFTREASHENETGSQDASFAFGWKILSATGTQHTTCTWTGGGGAEERYSGIAVFKGA